MNKTSARRSRAGQAIPFSIIRQIRWGKTLAEVAQRVIEEGPVYADNISDWEIVSCRRIGLHNNGTTQQPRMEECWEFELLLGDESEPSY